MDFLDSVDLGSATTFVGGATACGGTAVFTVSENTMVLFVSLLGALVGVAGLVYTVINGERNYRLRRLELEHAKIIQGDGHET